MPEGSSSAAPVIRPGPSSAKNFWIALLWRCIHRFHQLGGHTSPGPELTGYLEPAAVGLTSLVLYKLRDRRQWLTTDKEHWQSLLYELWQAAGGDSWDRRIKWSCSSPVPTRHCLTACWKLGSRSSVAEDLLHYRRSCGWQWAGTTSA